MTDNDKLDKSSTALIRSFFDKNVSQSNENVKSDTFTKYSMQNNQNNAQDNQGKKLSQQKTLENGNNT